MAPGITLPAEISGRRTAVFGISGAGKSNTATVIIEGLLASGEQIVCIDPKGEAWGLLSMASGKPSNLDIIIFGEPNGHIEVLSEAHGPKLADFVFESGRSVALSLLGFESDQSERRFVASFLRRLYRLKSKQPKKSRTLIVFDEAHLFVPEGGRSLKGEQSDLSGAVQRIARQGRTFGLGSLFVDQRPQDVAKRVISQVDTIICHQLTHKTDRDALGDWVKGYDTDGRGQMFLESLASLQPGEAWVWSPAWLQIFQRVKVNRRKTFDSGSAPDEATVTAVQRAEIDLNELRGQLEEIVEKAKADDPKELRKKIAQLKKQLSLGQTPVVDEKAIEQAVLARDNAWKQQFTRLRKSLDGLREQLSDASRQIAGDIGELLDLESHVLQTPISVTKPPAAPVKTAEKYAQIHTQVAESPKLGKAERAILQVLSQHPEGCEAGKLTLLSGYRFSGGFRNSLSTLRTAGLIEGENSGVMRITDAGLQVENLEPLPQGRDLIAYWLNHRSFGKCERAILASLLENRNGLTANELCRRTGYEFSGGFRNSLSTLRTAGVLVGRNTERMRAAEVLLE
jgi:hypothetical protein